MEYKKAGDDEGMDQGDGEVSKERLHEVIRENMDIFSRTSKDYENRVNFLGMEVNAKQNAWKYVEAKSASQFHEKRMECSNEVNSLHAEIQEQHQELLSAATEDYWSTVTITELENRSELSEEQVKHMINYNERVTHDFEAKIAGHESSSHDHMRNAESIVSRMNTKGNRMQQECEHRIISVDAMREQDAIALNVLFQMQMQYMDERTHALEVENMEVDHLREKLKATMDRLENVNDDYLCQETRTVELMREKELERGRAFKWIEMRNEYVAEHREAIAETEGLRADKEERTENQRRELERLRASHEVQIRSLQMDSSRELIAMRDELHAAQMQLEELNREAMNRMSNPNWRQLQLGSEQESYIAIRRALKEEEAHVVQCNEKRAQPSRNSWCARGWRAVEWCTPSGSTGPCAASSHGHETRKNEKA